MTNDLPKKNSEIRNYIQFRKGLEELINYHGIDLDLGLFDWFIADSIVDSLRELLRVFDSRDAKRDLPIRRDKK